MIPRWPQRIRTALRRVTSKVAPGAVAAAKPTSSHAIPSKQRRRQPQLALSPYSSEHGPGDEPPKEPVNPRKTRPPSNYGIRRQRSWLSTNGNDRDTHSPDQGSSPPHHSVLKNMQMVGDGRPLTAICEEPSDSPACSPPHHSAVKNMQMVGDGPPLTTRCEDPRPTTAILTSSQQELLELEILHEYGEQPGALSEDPTEAPAEDPSEAPLESLVAWLLGDELGKPPISPSSPDSPVPQSSPAHHLVVRPQMVGKTPEDEEAELPSSSIFVPGFPDFL